MGTLFVQLISIETGGLWQGAATQGSVIALGLCCAFACFGPVLCARF